ncbi:MAG: tail fiber domain-containing protein, partial [Candidatus Nanoarchaeia archaeon]
AAVWKDTTSSGGTVTSVTAEAPLTGGTITETGNIGINKANAATDGYLSKEDWATFNGKGTSNLELGETETTAYRGDRGKSAYEATQAATSANTASTIVKRDESGNFSAGTITANLAGNVTGNADTATTAGNVTGTVAVANGGTGATSAGGALTNLGIDQIATKKSNLSANSAPTVNDDSTQGYAVGSQWLDTTAQKSYVCLDATAGAAVWKDTTSSGGTVTSVTAEAPLTGGTITETGNIGINKANATTDGYLSKEDWATFNGKGTSNLELGETETTAYRGDRGKSAYDATQAATKNNTANTIVKRDASCNFSAGTITANLAGNADTATTAGNVTGTVAVANGGTGATSAGNARTNLGIDQIATKKSNLSANSAPTVDDDLSQGYAVGSQWLDTTADKSYICLDATAGAAVWKDTTSAGGTITSITADSPLTGGNITTTGTIGINKANATTDGYLSKEDWATFNGKGTSNLALGETDNTAYRGDYGKSAYDATQAATKDNTANTIVKRDASGNFSAGTITANLTGNADTVTNGVYTSGSQTIEGTKTFSDIDVNGGAIDGTTIGANSAAAGTFTNVTAGNTNAYYIGTDKALHKGNNSYTGNLVVGNGGSSISHSNFDSGYYNTLVGIEAGYNITQASHNTACGYQALNIDTTGSYNTALGVYALGSNSTAHYNTAVGFYALGGNTTGKYNTANGYRSLCNNSDGEYNTAVGFSSLYSNNSSYNTGCGYKALYSNSTGGGNTAIGEESGTTNTVGSNNTYVGFVCDADANNYTNSTAIGYNTIVTASNQVRLGNGAITSFYCKGAYAATTAEFANMFVDSNGQIMRSTSSARYKTDITDIEVDSSKIYDLRPVSFTGKNDGKRHFGLIAEEVAEVIPELAEYAKAKDVIPERTDDELVPDSVKYLLLPVLMLNEMKKLKAENDKLKAENEALKAKNEAMEGDIQAIKERLGM